MNAAYILLEPAGPKGGTATTAPGAPGASGPAGGAAPAAPGGGIMMFLPFLILIPFFFLMNRRNKKEQEARGTLKKGDRVSSTSGLVGDLIEIDERFAKVKIAPGVNVTMTAASIAPLEPAPASKEAKDAKDAKDAKPATDKK
ncbi:hypothetical protein BH09MYX1_BH09MYX1_14330 [soil metagenome]